MRWPKPPDCRSRSPRRDGRPGARLQQQRPVADAARHARRRGGGARRRGRIHRPQAPARPRPARRRSRGDRGGARGGRRRQSSSCATSTRACRWATRSRCHALDDQGLYWFEEPTTYDNIPRVRAARARAEDAGSARRELLRPALLYQAVARRRGRLRHARPDAHRRRHRLAARGGDRGAAGDPDVDAPLSRRSPRI